MRSISTWDLSSGVISFGGTTNKEYFNSNPVSGVISFDDTRSELRGHLFRWNWKWGVFQFNMGFGFRRYVFRWKRGTTKKAYFNGRSGHLHYSFGGTKLRRIWIVGPSSGVISIGTENQEHFIKNCSFFGQFLESPEEYFSSIQENLRESKYFWEKTYSSLHMKEQLKGLRTPRERHSVW